MRERRRAPRIPARLAMEIELGGKRLGGAQSINVSANGIYFSSQTYIEPLTKLRITLVLPKESPMAGEGRLVRCEGIVVRTEPDSPLREQGSYEIACYFTDVREEDREILESYILKQITF